MRTLLAGGADCCAREEQDKTPLMEAAVHGHPEAVRLLLLTQQQDASRVLELQCDGEVLHKCNAECVEVQEGVDAWDTDGATALVSACSAGHLQVGIGL
jgi:ankyrin repeat protein